MKPRPNYKPLEDAIQLLQRIEPKSRPVTQQSYVSGFMLMQPLRIPTSFGNRPRVGDHREVTGSLGVALKAGSKGSSLDITIIVFAIIIMIVTMIMMMISIMTMCDCNVAWDLVF